MANNRLVNAASPRHPARGAHSQFAPSTSHQTRQAAHARIAQCERRENTDFLDGSDRSRKLSPLHGSLARLLRHLDQALSGDSGTLGRGGCKMAACRFIWCGPRLGHSALYGISLRRAAQPGFISALSIRITTCILDRINGTKPRRRIERYVS